MTGCAGDVSFRLAPAIDDEALNALFAASWPNHRPVPFGPILKRSLVYVCAFAGVDLIGFVYLAWDGGAHAFLLDPTVHPRWRRRGVGRQLVHEAVAAARRAGVEWVHVDYEPHLRAFYVACGFRSTDAGLLRCTQE